MLNVYPHDSSVGHVTGRSEFVDDRAPVRGEIHVGIVMSSVAHGKLISIDFSEALKLPGVVGVYTAKDFKSGFWGPIFQDQPILVIDEVGYLGEPVALVAAETWELMKQAQEKVRLHI